MKSHSAEAPTVAIATMFAIATIGTGFTSGYVENYRQRMMSEAAELSTRAASVVNAILALPEDAALRSQLAHAKAVAVFPRVVKTSSSELEGGGGVGVVSRRTAKGWASPVFLRGAGGHGGPSFKSTSTDYVLLLTTEGSISSLGKEPSEPGAGIVSYSWSNGLLARVNFQSVILRAEDQLNMAVYTQTARELISGGLDETLSVSGGLKAFPQSLGYYSVATHR
jgi:lipid-binding SYLF domain-containing protein